MGGQGGQGGWGTRGETGGEGDVGGHGASEGILGDRRGCGGGCGGLRGGTWGLGVTHGCPPPVRQFADICLFSTAQYKCPVAQIEQE